jgi:hypothetical protein
VPRWLNCLLHPHRDRPCPRRKVTPGQREANAALGRANDAMREVEDLIPEVNRVAEQLREIRERNHFAESLYLLYRGGH